MAQITYDDKVYLNENASVPAINKVQDTDMNEIKNVINGINDGTDVVDNLVVGSVRTKNLIDSSSIVGGDIAGYNPTIRLISRQPLWIEPGTYTFSTNMSSSFDYDIWVQNVNLPPTEGYPDPYIYNSGWVNGSTTTTFTLTTAGWLAFGFRKPDNSALNPSDVSSFNFQLEVGDTATAYTPYQNTNATVSDINVYAKAETKIGIWIDDKPLYRRVFNISSITSSNSNLVDISNMNIREVVKVYGMLNTNNSQHFPMPLTDSSSNYSVVFATATVIRGRAVFGSGSFSSGWVALEYTKTTD